VREPVADNRLARRTLLVEPLGVSLPAGHPLADHATLTLRQLENELFVCFRDPHRRGMASGQPVAAPAGSGRSAPHRRRRGRTVPAGGAA
jgi:DNA-binding transcriptional LysR family regulator